MSPETLADWGVTPPPPPPPTLLPPPPPPPPQAARHALVSATATSPFVRRRTDSDTLPRLSRIDTLATHDSAHTKHAQRSRIPCAPWPSNRCVPVRCSEMSRERAWSAHVAGDPVQHVALVGFEAYRIVRVMMRRRDGDQADGHAAVAQRVVERPRLGERNGRVL